MIKLCTDEKNTRSKDQKMKVKFCSFPKCGTEFIGRGKAKYCDEHKKQKYKKILYQKNKNKGIGDANVYIKHSNLDSLRIIRSCALDGCDIEYEINLIPNQSIYPKYCDDHRNEYKREFFKMMRDKTNAKKEKK